jgi:hypothetical protein
MTKKEEIDAIVESIKHEDLVREREFTENLYVGRFNYFLIVFSLFMTTGFVNAVTPHKSAVFYVGAILLFLVWLPLYRGYKKHDRIMRLIFQNKEAHPVNAIERILALEGYIPMYRVSWFMGVLIPWACIGTLLFIALAFTHDVL